ncbi:MAG TPA: hypothetical protein VFV23_05070 [Verrucomicrobiae bacterium]|nr:hypothetical protein [Verrucomicrobiae bacterium]
MNEDFERELIAGLKQLGCTNRSQFIRDAIVEKLARSGVAIPPEFALPPHRIGKKRNEPQKVRYPAHKSSAFALNEKKASKKSRRSK